MTLGDLIALAYDVALLVAVGDGGGARAGVHDAAGAAGRRAVVLASSGDARPRLGAAPRVIDMRRRREEG